MSGKRLSEIRADLSAPKQKHERLWSHARELLAEVDELSTELAELRKLASKLKRGCDCIYDNRCFQCSALLDIKAAADASKRQ
jgi:uncharacterized coiled-coil DUF342 family protein